MSIKLSISIKGIIFKNDSVLLLKNERNEWELPGGRIEENETPEECLIREIHEELGLKCNVKKIIDSWVFEVVEGKFVFIVTYLCICNDTASILISDEHKEYKWFQLGEIEDVNVPEGYKQSIRKTNFKSKENNGPFES